MFLRRSPSFRRWWAPTGALFAHGPVFAQSLDPDTILAETSTVGFDSSETTHLIQSFLEMAAVLGFVCLLAYLVLGRLLPRVLRVPEATDPGRLLRVVDRLALDPKRSIMVVAMGEQHFLIGSSDHGLHWLARLDSSDVRDAIAAAEAAATPWGSGWFGAKKEKSAPPEETEIASRE